MLSSGTMAIWCVPHANAVAAQNANSLPTQIEAHFNYWRVEGKKTPRARKARLIRDFIEVGLMIEDIALIKEIGIYVPMKIERQMVEDCAPYLSKPEFAQGIFNEPITAIPPASGMAHFTVLQYQNNNVFCRVHNFALSNNMIDSSELDIKDEFDGTTLTITNAAISAISVFPPSPNIYFRIRFILESPSSKNPFIKIIPTLDGFLQSGFDEIEYLDFRVNEARTLPPAIESRIATNHLQGAAVEIKRIVFLTAVPVNSELIVSSAPAHKTRLLEQLWDNYSQNGIPRGMVVYHWKKESPSQSANPNPPQSHSQHSLNNKPLTDFSAFVKLQTRRSSGIKYLGFAFLFGLCGNIAATWLMTDSGDFWNRYVLHEQSHVDLACRHAAPSGTNSHPVGQSTN